MLDAVDQESNLKNIPQIIARDQQKAILDYARDNDIVFHNLFGHEREELIKIAAERDPAQKIQKLNRWKDKLVDAVNGRGPHVAMHGAQYTGMIDQHKRTGQIDPHAWGTDLDARHALGGLIDGRKILPPMSLTEAGAKTNLKATLQEVLNHTNNDEKLSVNFLANQRNNHWRAVNIKIEKGQIVAVTLFEPGQNSDLKLTDVYRNLAEVVKSLGFRGDVKAVEQKLQNDGYRCMDFSLRTVLQEVAPNHPIAKAEIQDLRSVTIKTIFENQNTHYDSLEQALTDQEFQIEFDSLMAKELSKLYQSNPKEDGLVTLAKENTLKNYYQTHGFFANHKSKAANDPSLSNNLTPTPTKNSD